MQLTQFIERKNVIMNFYGKDKNQVIEEMAKLLMTNGSVNNLEQYLAAVHEREKHCTTGIGNGVAIPHGKTEAVKCSAIAVAKLSEPLEWQAMDDAPVSLVFLLAIQESDAADLHLQLLQQIAVKLMDDAIIAALHKAESVEDLLAALAMEAEEY